ncbi:D-threo-aldose 1-dehydrogenase [Fistulifera solaris]|uniref:D-threo-aldose 1-dehydrogenase n=1 Tax=Fistulifera solaris TaxID=1519565 RepID=A0A1Z5K3T9_FISSO|nr:D-threo-aldose 1-dehydrogenase [Fistulifera solaris]|eukprot:GAX20920.1 D-threo-aldose 1-dehydrogenase [Fistulifera solaris]
MSNVKDMPQRALAGSKRFPVAVSIVGLGCSSFSTFFWSPEELQQSLSDSTKSWSVNDLDRNHPRVQEWIRTIHFALKQGITYLDTAPWYGHGTSEVVIGWALEAIEHFDRSSIQINTKVGRYEADPSKMFDFSREKTQKSVELSLQRMKCGYIDILQLHDPEFAPTLDQLLEETIPVMLECRKAGRCKALGLTGYPLHVQHLVLQRSMERFGENIWDQSLTYCHYNLHDQSLVNQPLSTTSLAFLESCQQQGMVVLAAAPLSMGLLSNQGPRDWHPASAELKEACRRAVQICQQEGIDISRLALLFALSNERVPCTVVGMKNEEEVELVLKIAKRIGHAVAEGAKDQEDVWKAVLNDAEQWFV